MSDKPILFKILRILFALLNFVSNIGLIILIMNLLTITEQQELLSNPTYPGNGNWKQSMLTKFQILIALIATSITLTSIQGILGWIAICSLKPSHLYIYSVLVIINLIFFISTVSFDSYPWEGCIMGIVYDALLALMMFNFIKEIKNLYY